METTKKTQSTGLFNNGLTIFFSMYLQKLCLYGKYIYMYMFVCSVKKLKLFIYIYIYRCGASNLPL